MAEHPIGLLAQRVLSDYPDAAARELERVEPPDAARLLAGRPAAEAARVVRHLTPDAAVAILAELGDAPLSAVLGVLDTARAAALWSRLDGPARARWVAALGPRAAKEVAAESEYPADTAGGNMDARVMAARPHTTVGEALDRLPAYADRTVRRIFLVDGERRLAGSVELQTLVTAPRDATLGSLVTSPPVAVAATAGLEEVTETAVRHDRGTLAVLDYDGRLVGVLNHDAILDAARQDASGDLASMVGASREERALSPVTFAVKKRLPWLQVNLGTAFLASGVVAVFEDTIARNTALAVLLPVVAGQSGNTGAQALAVTMRGLTMREVRTSHVVRVTLKEVRVGFLNGIGVALTTSLAVLAWSASPGLALVIGTSMVISMTAAGLAGAVIPMLLTSLGMDPAQSSSIVLTTVTDVVGFFSFLGIATVLSSML